MARQLTPAQRAFGRKYPVPRLAPLPKPATESFWLTAPREGFAKAATQHRFSTRQADQNP